ncbi:MAG TPA: S41 family peptidase [Thermoflexales bacterium]|nr:S41 family peptidase [Thermoflexales bacterium]HQZ54517.1 S41 family peptidase [Thermoflexales bacterium]
MNQPAPSRSTQILRGTALALVGVFAGMIIFAMGIAAGITLTRGDFSFRGASAFPPPGTATGSISVTPAARAAEVDQKLINETLAQLRNNWYGELPSSDALTNGAIRGMVAALGDDFTAYVEPKYARMLEDDASGSFEGIGATLRSVNGAGIQIVRVFDGFPAAKAGVQSGDAIESVNGVKVATLSATEVAALIRGPGGTPVVLRLRRADTPKPFEITVVRGKIVIPLVTSKMIGTGTDKIGYVSLYDFSANARQQLEPRIRELLDQKPKGLILDLRDNPGGLLSQAVEVGDLFLPEGDFIIERDQAGNVKRLRTTNSGIAQTIPLAVLVNGGSASASEIVAGAIQDYGRGQVIGETTFGKGSVQLPKTLSNGAQLRITIERWFTPKDRAIHGTGIAPDITVARSSEDSKANRDPQLDAAVNFLQTGVKPAP